VTRVYENSLSDTLDLCGAWRFALGDDIAPPAEIHVPGCWEAQGYDKQSDGPAVYHRPVRVPEAWAGRRVFIRFDAVSYHAEVAVDGQAVGAHQGMWTPFELDLTDHLTPGRKHEITLTAFKPGERFPLRETLAGFLPDVCTTFGGIWQPARLIAHAGPTFSDIRLAADADTGALQLRAQLNPIAGPARALSAVLEVLDPEGGRVATAREALPALDAPRALDFALVVPEFQRWAPGSPALYTAEIRAEHSGHPVAVTRRRFGFRRLSSQGEQLLFNGAPVCLRGLLHWGWYPDLLCPMPNAETVREEFRRAREMGFNLIKLCLFVPSPIYFEVADEEGMFLWLELPMWLPLVTPGLRAQAPLEYADILARVHHHPSVVVYSLGCELNRTVDAELLARLNDIARSFIVGAQLCDNSGSGECYGGLRADFADFSDYHFYCDLQYFDPLVDQFRREWRPPRPWIFGEFCDSDDYREPEELAAAHGSQPPWWFGFDNPILGPLREAQRHQIERVTALDWTQQELKRVSRQESLVVRKSIVEKVRRRAGMGGYAITGFRDTPIATSGVFDDLGRAKFPPEEFRAFTADTVLILDGGRERTWRHGGDRPRRRDLFNHQAGQPIDLRLILAHAGPALPDGELTWRALDAAGQTLAENRLTLPGPLMGGRPQEIAAVQFAAPDVEQATALALEARLSAGGVSVTNRWTLWVYPAADPWPEGVGFYDPAGSLDCLDDLADAAARVRELSEPPRLLVAGALPPGLPGYLRDGGRALLLQWGSEPLAVRPCPFWRESIKLFEDHPVMRAMPHAGFADLQFYSLATDWALEPHALARAMPDVREVTPLLTRLDAREFTLAHYLVEARLDRGRVMASTLRFQGGLGDQPTGLRDNPVGRFLLRQILDYLLT
jgi:hypothetical protein